MDEFQVPKPHALGVDVGGVIIEPMDNSDDTSFFGPNYLRTPAIEGAFDALRVLNRAYFPGCVYLVSKCEKRVQAHTLDWLAHHDFHGYTGIPVEHVHFCRQRHEKGEIAARLGLTHFVDDRLEVLSYLRTVAVRCLFRGRPAELQSYAHLLPQVAQVATWSEALPVLGGASRAQA